MVARAGPVARATRNRISFQGQSEDADEWGKSRKTVNLTSKASTSFEHASSTKKKTSPPPPPSSSIKLHQALNPTSNNHAPNNNDCNRGAYYPSPGEIVRWRIIGLISSRVMSTSNPLVPAQTQEVSAVAAVLCPAGCRSADRRGAG